jgi:hypothetical protein
VAPTDSAALDPDLLKVQHAGTKIIFEDTSSANSAIGLSRISSDNEAGGKLAADTLGKLLGGKGTVAVISVAKGCPRPTPGSPVSSGDGGQIPGHQAARRAERRHRQRGHRHLVH